jgi:putative oligomerization/nucleic acid binding protein
MGLIRGMARVAVISGTATAVSNRVSRRQANRWSEQEGQQEQAAAAAPPAPEAPSTDDKLAQLKELGELKAAGVLTDAEFEVQKEKILQG